MVSNDIEFTKSNEDPSIITRNEKGNLKNYFGMDR